jgi:hypothetical protein
VTAAYFKKEEANSKKSKELKKFVVLATLPVNSS